MSERWTGVSPDPSHAQSSDDFIAVTEAMLTDPAPVQYIIALQGLYPSRN